jgi:DNA polymerase
MNAQRRDYLHALGLDLWVRRGSTAAPGTPRADTLLLTASAPLEAVHATALDWDPLAQRVAGCTACPLHAGRTQTVFGVGDRRAPLMVVGEAPGAEEDRRGEPFVGRAGQLLDSMLKAMGFARSDVFIANVLKCRPPGNRDPRPTEVEQCFPFLERQIELVDPRAILCVGRIAAQNLLKTDAPLGRLRGRVHHLGNDRRPVVVTYHPAYLLRSPGEKRKAWQDLLLALDVLGTGSQREARA